MEKRTLFWLVGAAIAIIAAIVLFKFAKTQGGAISSMPGSASNWFQQVGTPSSKNGADPVIILQK